MATAKQSTIRVQPFVFWASVGLILGALLVSIVATEQVGNFFDQVQQFIVARFGWLYILSMTGFLVFVVWLMLSRFGRIRLGPDDARPEFSRPTWFAMLFSAGMGIGLLFFSVAEPIMHYMAPPEATASDLAAARQAMGLTYFHWGLHPWAVYALVGLALAYFCFRKGLPLAIRSAFEPLLGDRIYGRAGDIIDTLAVVSTLFGVATSLGLGAQQVNAGLGHLFGVSQSATMQVVIIAIITAMATASVVSGLHVGIRRLSEINMSVAGLLAVFLLIAGPTAFLLDGFVDNLGAYLEEMGARSFWTAGFDGGDARSWLRNWTIFYWAWWIAWAPFVGMFIARISRVRTIREFIGAVLFAPTLAGFIWLTIFGDTALHEELFGGGGLATAVQDNVATAIFVLFERFPLAEVTGTACTLCIVLFFVTSSDSASLVVDIIASGGEKDPVIGQRIFWAVLEGVVAAVLLLTGGLLALQTAAITTALPLCLIIIAMAVGLHRALRGETS